MRSLVEKFGSAVYAPVIFGAFTGIVYGVVIVLLPLVIDIPALYSILLVIKSGAWTFFQILPILFAVAIPIGMVEKNKENVALTALMSYATMILMLNTMMSVLGVDVSSVANMETGYTDIFAVKVYDMSILGSIISGSIVTIAHNRFYDARLPEFLNIFSGKVFVYVISFVILIPATIVIAIVWPYIQNMILSMQAFIISSGGLGVFVYTFLERILIPTGLHHLVYQPFQVGPAVVNEGLMAYWTAHMTDFAQSSERLGQIYPQGGYGLTGMSKMFAPIGISLAFYKTAFPENRKRLLGILIPTASTAVLFGITEPFEFAFLFISPVLFLIHSILAASMSTIVYLLGSTGYAGGLMMTVPMNWLPMFPNHSYETMVQISVGCIFIVVYYYIFKTLILKYNMKTPGREDFDEEVSNDELGSTGDEKVLESDDELEKLLLGIGGVENIKGITHCATRLRVKIENLDAVRDNDYFKRLGYHGVVKSKTNIQIIVGVGVAKLYKKFDEYVERKRE